MEGCLNLWKGHKLSYQHGSNFGHFSRKISARTTLRAHSPVQLGWKRESLDREQKTKFGKI